MKNDIERLFEPIWEEIKRVIDCHGAFIYLFKEGYGLKLTAKFPQPLFAKESISGSSKLFLFWGDFVFLTADEETKRVFGIDSGYIAIHKLGTLGFLVLHRKDQPFTAKDLLSLRKLLEDFISKLEQVLVKEEKSALEENYKRLVSLIPAGILTFDQEKGILRPINRMAGEILELGEGSQKIRDIKNPSILSLLNKVSSELKSKEQIYLEAKLELKRGTVWVELRARKTENNIILVIHDISYKKKLEENIRRLAFFDQDSKIPNRNYLKDFLDSINRNNFLVFVGILNWDELNNLYGYLRLNKIASELFYNYSASLSKYGMVFRFSDRVLVVSVNDQKGLDGIFDMLKRHSIIEIKDNKLTVKLLLGGLVMEYPKEVRNIEELAYFGFVGLHYLKRKKLTGLHFMSKLENLKEVAEHFYKVSDFWEIIEPVFHPIHRAKDGSVAGAEVLARIKTPFGKLLSVGTLFEIIEDESFIVELDRVLWKKLTKLYTAYLKNLDLFITFNISPISLLSEEFVKTLLEDTRIIGRAKLCLEITERESLAEDKVVLDRINLLKSSGYQIAIDDFGSGTASLNYLRFLNADKLKIDGSIIKDVDKNPRTQALVAGVSIVSRKMGIEVGAEFVERKEQAEILKRLGCTLFQGHLFSKPMELESFLRLVAVLA